ncbi:MAG: hypothetical protein GQ535_02195 [Rhodobacteraceae bacterium]|nr:hypothetical protein [Paracoccaceae bacterium]
MEEQFNIDEKQVTVGDWRIHIVQSVRSGSLAPFRNFTPEEFEQRSRRPISLDSPRCRVYRDAYAMIFMASNGEPIPVCGDLTVLHNLINENYLSYDGSKFTIEIGCTPLATKCFGLQHRGDDDNWYQAVLNKR